MASDRLSTLTKAQIVNLERWLGGDKDHILLVAVGKVKRRLPRSQDYVDLAIRGAVVIERLNRGVRVVKSRAGLVATPHRTEVLEGFVLRAMRKMDRDRLLRLCFDKVQPLVAESMRKDPRSRLEDADDGAIAALFNLPGMGRNASTFYDYADVVRFVLRRSASRGHESRERLLQEGKRQRRGPMMRRILKDLETRGFIEPWPKDSRQVQPTELGRGLLAGLMRGDEHGLRWRRRP